MPPSETKGNGGDSVRGCVWQCVGNGPMRQSPIKFNIDLSAIGVGVGRPGLRLCCGFVDCSGSYTVRT